MRVNGSSERNRLKLILLRFRIFLFDLALGLQPVTQAPTV